MHLAPGLQAPADGLHHLFSDPVHGVVDTGRTGSLVAFYRKEGLGNGDGDLGRVKANEGAVAFDDLKGFCSGNRRGLGGQDGRHGTSPCVRVVAQPLRSGEGGGFCHGIHGRTRKNEKKGTVLPRNPRTKIHYEKKKAFYLFLSCSLVDFVAKKSVSLFFPCSSVDSVAKKPKPACSPL